MSIYTPLNVKAFKNFKGVLCPASVFGALDLRYLVEVADNTVTYRVKSKNRTVYKGVSPTEAAEAYNKVLAKAEAAQKGKK